MKNDGNPRYPRNNIVIKDQNQFTDLIRKTNLHFSTNNKMRKYSQSDQTVVYDFNSFYIVTYIVTMVAITTIQISTELKEALKMRKLHSKESYEDIIWDLLEDQMQLKDEIVEQIEIGRKAYLEGKFETMDDLFGEN